jgi:dihydroorotate dehydrogenase electron transfer subunit
MAEISSRIFETVEIASNRQLPNSELMLLSFFCPKVALMSKPGQFVEIGFEGTVLPKPISIHRVHKFGVVELLYQVIGKGTKILASLQDGTPITVLGPLGNGFNLESQGPYYLVGGGTGIAPMLDIHDRIGNKEHKIFLGARTKSLLPDPGRFPKETSYATDDGTFGFKGTIVDLINQSLLPQGTILACGPKPMLRALHERFKGWPMQFSLESYMACGVGACLGCVVNTKSGYKKVCADGPVFDATEVIDGL